MFWHKTTEKLKENTLPTFVVIYYGKAFVLSRNLWTLNFLKQMYSIKYMYSVKYIVLSIVENDISIAKKVKQ